jgi:hypothetical protein
MVRSMFAWSLLLAAPALAQPAQTALRPTAAALQIFERDWVLMNWALKYFDVNGDILLEPAEAQAAAERFRQIADVNRDGRLTPEEYRAAREHILTQY